MIPLPLSRRVYFIQWKSLTFCQASTLACGGLLLLCWLMWEVASYLWGDYPLGRRSWSVENEEKELSTTIHPIHPSVVQCFLTWMQSDYLLQVSGASALFPGNPELCIKENIFSTWFLSEYLIIVIGKEMKSTTQSSSSTSLSNNFQ